MKQESYIIASKIAKTIMNVATDKEKSDVTAWSSINKANKDCLDNLRNKISNGEQNADINEFDVEQAWQNVEFKLLDYRSRDKKVKTILNVMENSILVNSFYKYVAVFLIVFALGLSIYKYTMPNDSIDIKSINEGAYMVLANGEVLDLSSNISCKSKDYILNNNDSINTIYYNVTNKKAAQTNVGSNIIKTEKGINYSIYLPDGTLARLNSASYLKFPEKFDDKNRTVEVSGEVYFDVAHNKDCPFIVKTAGVEIEVLGTLFNVCSYDDSQFISTTLVSGSVKLRKGDSELILKPNQKALMLRNVDKISVSDVDTDFEVSWINGNFSFRNERLADIMKSLSRWYDFKYVFLDSQCEDILVGLNLERGVEFKKIVEILQRADLFGMQVSGNKIVISKK